MTFRLECRPAFNYGRDEHSVTILPEGACFHSPGLSLGLTARVPLAREDGGVVATFSLREGDAAVFLLEEIEAGCGVCLSESEAGKVFVETVKYWRRWLANAAPTAVAGGRW